MLIILLAILFSCFFQNIACSKTPLDPVGFVPQRGFFNSPISVELSSPFGKLSPTILIRYTVTAVPEIPPDPSINFGNTYTVPFSISKTSMVLAISYEINPRTQVIIRTSNLTTHTYLFPSDIIRQSEMDQATINKHGAELAQQSLLTIPSLVITSKVPYPTETDRINRPKRGDVEWIDPHSDDTFLAPVIYDRRGGSSRSLPKKSIKLTFNDDSLPGDQELDFPLFDGVDFNIRAANKIHKVILRSSKDNALTNLVWTPGLYIRGVWNDHLMQELGCVTPHSRLIHLYFNGIYFGIITLREIMEQKFFKEYLGGNSSDYEVVNNGDVLNNLPFSTVMNALVATPNYATFNKYVDWDSFFAYHISIDYTGNFDVGFDHNWYFGGPIHPTREFAGKRGGWKFYMHDNDVQYMYPFQDTSSFCYKTGYRDRCLTYSGPNASVLAVDHGKSFFTSLIAEGHPEFMLRFQDAQQRLYMNPHSPLSTIGNQARFDAVQNAFFMNRTMIAEAARWGFELSVYNTGYSLATYMANFRLLRDEWASLRHAFFIQQYKEKGWTNTIDAVTFSHVDDAIVNQNTIVKIIGKNNAPNYDIIYTLNGEDPRTPDSNGQANSNARVVNTKNAQISVDIVANYSFILKARIRVGTKWSALNQVSINVQPLNSACLLCNNLIITEVHYHADTYKSDPSFIELKNIGNKPLVLTGSRIKGIKYRFPTLVLEPNQFWIIARYHDDFKKVYQRAPDDTFFGELGRGKKGDSFKIIDSVGNEVFELEYGTLPPFSQLPDGFGYTLVAKPEEYATIAFARKGKLARYYRYSAQIHGSPGRDDPNPFNTNDRKMGLTFEFVSFEDNWIKLFNPSFVDSVDISKWVFSDRFTPDDPFALVSEKAVIPPRSSLKVSFSKPVMKIARSRCVMLFRKNNDGYFTGEFIEFDATDHELAF